MVLKKSGDELIFASGFVICGTSLALVTRKYRTGCVPNGKFIVFSVVLMKH